MINLASFTPFVLSINILLIICLVFLERKDSSTTWAWVLILTFIPILGFMLYLCFGQNIVRQKKFNEKILDDEIKNTYCCLLKNNYTHDIISPEYIDLIELNFNDAVSPYTQNNNVDLFFDGKELFSDIFSEIEKAKKFIHIEFYIFGHDEISTSLLKLLTKKAKEGVEVKLLIDCVGNGTRKKALDDLKAAGGEVSIFFNSFFRYINLRINYRNHRKIVIIDSDVAYLGGFNVGDEYLGHNKKIGYWRDTHIKIIGDAINDLEARFILDWTYSNNEELSKEYKKYFFSLDKYKGKTSMVCMQIVSSGPDHSEQKIKNGYVKMINKATERLFIQSPYFVPDDCLLECLKISALSGVDVRLMLPGNPDHKFMGFVANSYIEDLIKSGVKVYFYNNGFLHCKCIVCDGELCSIGTANMDIRSFKLNFETNSFIYNSNISKKLENQFYKDMEYCTLIELDSFSNRPLSGRFFESICRLVSPLM